MNIEFIPSSKQAELVAPMPRPAKNYIPEWYKNILGEKNISFLPDNSLKDSSNGIKRCMPFLDGFTAGYIQESWTDIYIKKSDDGQIIYSFPQGPEILLHREHNSFPIPNTYYNLEFIWKVHWMPKLPKGWSAIFTHPHNRLDLPFTTLTGVVDSDLFYNMQMTGSNYPFFIKKDFEGLIPVGTPLYQIIPFKRESWKSSSTKFDEFESYVRVSKTRKYLMNGYKKAFWQKKSYD